MANSVARKYNPMIDNYMLSIPSEPQEEWRNGLQLLYDNMKHIVVDPIAIGNMYYED